MSYQYLRLISSFAIGSVLSIYPFRLAQAGMIEGTSILCNNRNLFTMLAFSTEKFNIAICKHTDGAYYYVGQNKRNNDKIFLPISEVNNPYIDTHWLLKAVNGQYTYQVFEVNAIDRDSYVTISVFQNGRRIYYRKVDTYMGALDTTYLDSNIDGTGL